MADPATMMLVATVAGTGMQAYSQYQQGKEQEKVYKQQARTAAQNAAIKRAEAQRTREISREAGREKRKEKRAYLARQIVLYAKSGVRAGLGTAALVGAETERRLERQAQVIQERGVFGYQQGVSQADIYGQQASYFKGAAKTARRSGLWAAGATLATGLSGVARQYYKFKPSTTVKTLSTARKTSGWQWKTDPWSYSRNF